MIMEEKTTPHLEDLNRQQSIQNGNEPSNPIKDASFYRDGLTKRETIAMHLCSAYVSNGDNYHNAVSSAVLCTDALLEELRKNKAK